MHTESYSISDLERLSGVKAHTIRIWEKRYGIISPARSGTNIRRYTNAQLRHLLNISLLNQHGFKISRIGDMSAADIEDAVIAVTRENAKGAEAGLLLSLLDMSEQLFAQSFAQLTQQRGFEDAFINGIFPFFERIGIMWQVGTITPAQEHFFSNLVRAELIAATRQLPLPTPEGKPPVLLFLPEQELHEIGLLFYNYALRRRGYSTIYLGQSVPLDSLPAVIASHQPAMVITGVTMEMTEKEFSLFARHISQLCAGQIVYFTGPVPVKRREHLPGNTRFTQDLWALLKQNAPST